MDQLQPFDESGSGHQPIERRVTEFCRYCGAPLHAFFYFCLRCGTPYKHPETVVTPAAPVVLTEGELIQMKAPAVAPIFWTYFAVVVFSGIISGILFYEDRPDLAIIFSDVLLFVTTCIVTTIYWKSLVAQFKQIGFGHSVAWLALLLLVPMLGINYAYSTFLVELGVETDDLFARLRETMSEWALVLIICVSPAVLEEIAFRGLVQHWLQVAIHPVRAIGLASFLFALIHFNILGFPYLFIVGVLLGWAKWKTGSLYPSMLIHFLHNFVVLEYL